MTNKFLKAIWSMFLFGALLVSPSHAQREQLFVGARPLGLGETFVAIANDGNAIFWNPAGLPFLKREEFNSMYSNLYGLGLKNRYVSYLRPLTDRLAFGADWMRYGFEDEELAFSRNQFALSAGLALRKNLSLGANVKHLRTDASLAGNSEGAASGWGLDLGLLYAHEFTGVKFLKQLRAGLMLHDATDTRVQYNTGKSEVVLPRNLRLGMAYQPFDKWRFLHEPLLALDVDDRLHAGSEIWLRHDEPKSLLEDAALALRAGMQKDLYSSSDEGLTWSAGFSLKKDFVRFDYAYTMPPTLPASHRFSVSFAWNFNPHLVEIGGAHIEPVFSSLARHYHHAKTPVGKAYLRNKHDAPITAKISFEVEGFTKGAFTWPVKVDTGKAASVDLFAVFSEGLLKTIAIENNVKGKIKVSYNYQGRTYTEDETVRFLLHGDGTITWNEPRKAASFVTQNDSLVRAFAAKDYGARAPAWIARTEIADALELYEAMRAYGVRPTRDPDATISAATDSNFYLDTITWPDALLSAARDFRAGDCEDLAILYAALLAGRGIETALLKMPGHIFMMFNTDVPAAHRHALPLPDSLLVEANDMLWVPVETTMLPASFLAAWQRGARTYAQAAHAAGWQTIFVRDEQKTYPPVEHAPIKRKWFSPPDSASIQSALAHELGELARMKEQFLSESFQKILDGHGDSLNVRNQLGCYYAGMREFEAARGEFETVLQFDSTYAPAL
ncbi:PorV/PorQ family protein, partial [candidate division KSB1 bacterium]|nr:PorV/PorQ family protein [candidate division KSB1 bacterium]